MSVIPSFSLIYVLNTELNENDDSQLGDSHKLFLGDCMQSWEPQNWPRHTGLGIYDLQ